MTQKIKIKNVEYELKYNIKTMFIFERLTDKVFEPTKLFDLHIFFYSCLLANNENFTILANDFIEMCDEEPRLFIEFLDFFRSSIAVEKQLDDLNGEEVISDDKKKD